MGLYRYFILTQKGKRKQRFINADSMEEAKSVLRKKGEMVASISSVEEKQMTYSLSKKEVLIFAKELSKLLYAGLPLYESLISIEEKHENSKAHIIFLHLCDQIKKGISLSQALSFHAKSFDFFFCSMITHAEKVGNMAEILQEIAEILEKQMQLKKKMISVFLYPSILAAFSLILVFSLLFFVIPSLFDLFEERNLHPVTQIILSLSQFLSVKKKMLAFVAGGFIFFIFFVWRSIFFKEKVKRFFFHLPFIRTVIKKAALVRFCRTFSSLLKGGVPYVQAMGLSEEVIYFLPLKKVVILAKKKVMEGERLSRQFKDNPHIPSLVPRMLSLAEEGGDMPFMLDQIASFYQEDLEKVLVHFTTILQPSLLIILGCVVGFIILAVLLPLTDVGSFLSG